MTDGELDRVYTALCEALSSAGEAQALPLLSRFALLAMLDIDDAGAIEAMIGRALRSLDDGPSTRG